MYECAKSVLYNIKIKYYFLPTQYQEYIKPILDDTQYAGFFIWLDLHDYYNILGFPKHIELSNTE